MPRASGTQLIAGLISSGFQGQFIIFSASLGNAEREALDALGVTEIIRKPRLDELTATVQRLTTAG